MNIILTQKDADFILKYIRADLKKVSDNYNNLSDSYDELLTTCTKQGFSEDKLNIIHNAVGQIKDDFLDMTKEIQEELAKCVELLTIGSEKD